MTDPTYKRMLIRRRFCRRLFLAVFVFGISFYGSILLFGNLKTPRIMNLTHLNRCPACYGVSVCPELYSNQITLEPEGWFTFFNTKNIYHASIKSNRRAVLKKLAHDWELNEFDQNLCKNWGLKKNCKPTEIVNVTNIEQKIVKLVQYNVSYPDTEPRKGLVLCPYSYSLFDLVSPALSGKTNNKFELTYLWTMLTINPEPIILQVIPKSHGWPVPPYGGVCGRVELVGYEGEPLSSLMDIKWHRKLKFADQILRAAMDFTFKHNRFRFYFMDWSLDNIVANDEDTIAFVDLEDVVILDKLILPRQDLPDWYKRYSRENFGPGFTFSISSMCKHHLSDHNIWAACYILAGDDNPLLYPIPEEVNTTRPHLDRLLKTCLYGDNRWNTVTKLQHVIDEMLVDSKITRYYR